MKRHAFVIVVTAALALIGCLAVAGNQGSTQQSTRCETAYHGACQYVVTEQGGITHKGDCSNGFHK